MSEPVVVLISDIHFATATLELASSSLSQAMREAQKLGVPLVIAGDTLDGKALIRGECANRLVELFEAFLEESFLYVYILVGNHDLLNEKGREHSLNFLNPYAQVVQSPVYVEKIKSWLIPYHHDTATLQEFLKHSVPAGSRIIMHQGVQTAFMGHYVQDKTSLPKEVFADYRVISGHYHRAQDIKCGRPRKGAVGLFTYIGSPYTTSFAEAEDGIKGFRVLYDDGSLTTINTRLRRHHVYERTFQEIQDMSARGHKGPLSAFFDGVGAQDLVWLKVKGTYAELESLDKKELGLAILGHSNYKLDKIYTDAPKVEQKVENSTGEELLDALIDNTKEASEQKAYLKLLWREIIS